ncbi:MAG: TIGR03364 family FAD-dependent oxidoreductase [Cyclobacteriaceae bacterium]|nr:TIGR03364 family FAD-dependent oxidoreductase [Cyclobacteriaceae bacterium]
MKERLMVGIVGSGIIGLAHALAFARQNCQVTVYERESTPLGASIRNFGLFWPLGQEKELLGTVARSKQIWYNILDQAGIQVNRCGSLIVAPQLDELEVIREFFELESHLRPGLTLNSRNELSAKYRYLRHRKLLGGLRSSEEFCVNPRTAIPKIITFLQSHFDVKFRFNTTIREVSDRYLYSDTKLWQADVILICTGDEYSTLLPQHFAKSGLHACHLQMMKAIPKAMIDLKSVFCGGLSMIQYPSFSSCKSLKEVKHRHKEEMPGVMKAGIHVILSQNTDGELIIGDSHLYQSQKPVFIDQGINNMIIQYLDKFMRLPDYGITEQWQGSYSFHPYKKHYFEQTAQNIWVSTGFGGAGMTLGFGQAEENVAHIIDKIGIHANPTAGKVA